MSQLTNESLAHLKDKNLRPIDQYMAFSNKNKMNNSSVNFFNQKNYPSLLHDQSRKMDKEIMVASLASLPPKAMNPFLHGQNQITTPMMRERDPIFAMNRTGMQTVGKTASQDIIPEEKKVGIL